MKYDKSSDSIIISSTELSTFAFQRENPQLLAEKYGFIKSNSQKSYVSGCEVQSYVPLEKELIVDDYRVTITALTDIITFDGLKHTVEKVKNVTYMRRDISPLSDPCFFADTAISAYIYAEKSSLDAVELKLSFAKESSGDVVSFTAVFGISLLRKMFEALIARSAPFIKYFAKKSITLPDEIKALPFPYHNIREGQEEFIRTAHKAISHGEVLLVSAPTGIGKTMSSLFPAIKAVGNGKTDKVFYVTAKNITGQVALEAVEKLGKYAPHLRAVNISAKEQICPLRKAGISIGNRLNCRRCDLTGTVNNLISTAVSSYRERELEALKELVEMDTILYTTDVIKTVAEKHMVCPYELSLDISEYVTVIVCDYNYVIDDNIRFKRYFKNINSNEKYVFLFDEAHNLPDRTRNTYSASLQGSVADELTILSENEFSKDTSFVDAVANLSSALDCVRNLCRENEYYRSTDNGEIVYGYYESDIVPSELVQSISSLNAILSGYIRKDSEYADLLSPYYDKLSKFLFANAYFDNKFRFFANRENEKISIELLCIDPSGILNVMLQPAKSAVLFSATLSPTEYFRDVIGFPHAQILELSSPYEKNNLCLIAYDSISTKLADRRDTALECAEVVVQTISQKQGNYIVYFPSYDYMKRVCKVFARMMPNCAIVMQKQGMSYRERERFINVFRDRSRESVVGFCVLGGMFSEGIDLAGESLIGAIIVGTGMPSLSAERNIMEAYYNENNGSGHEYAYVCPGMNKVLQAAGRVIRSEHDKGVVVLIDDRYSTIGMKMLFPPHWRHIKYTGNLTSLNVILSDFWEKQK